MNSVIKNNNGVYIRILNGKVTTCSESMKDIFTEDKARNILNSLPKTLRRYHFYVQTIYNQPKVIESSQYKVGDEITRWIDKFGLCGEILNEAKDRSDILLTQISACEDEIIDILHEIELKNNMDMYSGWLTYVKIRDTRVKRRKLKDELLIISDVLEQINPDCLQRSRIQKAVDGLEKRKYTYRNNERK